MDNEQRIGELEENIKKWQKEYDEIWREKNTPAAEVERRNLQNLINNAKRKINELKGIEENDIEDFDLSEFKEKMAILKSTKMPNEEKVNRLLLQKERLIEEQKDYAKPKNGVYQNWQKEIYQEYQHKIEEIDKEIENYEKEFQKLKDEATKYIEANKDTILRTIYIELKENDTKISELDEKLAAKQKEEMVNENQLLQNYREELKGKEKAADLTTEDIKFFHGQGDHPERTTAKKEQDRENRLENDQYFFEDSQGRYVVSKEKESNKVPKKEPDPTKKDSKDSKPQQKPEQEEAKKVTVDQTKDPKSDSINIQTDDSREESKTNTNNKTTNSKSEASEILNANLEQESEGNEKRSESQFSEEWINKTIENNKEETVNKKRKGRFRRFLSKIIEKFRSFIQNRKKALPEPNKNDKIVPNEKLNEDQEALLQAMKQREKYNEYMATKYPDKSAGPRYTSNEFKRFVQDMNNYSPVEPKADAREENNNENKEKDPNTVRLPGEDDPEL